MVSLIVVRLYSFVNEGVYLPLIMKEHFFSKEHCGVNVQQLSLLPSLPGELLARSQASMTGNERGISDMNISSRV